MCKGTKARRDECVNSDEVNYGAVIAVLLSTAVTTCILLGVYMLAYGFIRW